MSYEVFLSYNTRDLTFVGQISDRLTSKGISTFIDRFCLQPGVPWPSELERALKQCNTVVIFCGPSGFGHWQEREIHLALDIQAHDPSFLVIPVLLPDADLELGFLALNTWIDFRAGCDDVLAFDVLYNAIQRNTIEKPHLTDKEPVDDICPYRGLRYFRELDAPFFCGREVYIDRVLKKIKHHNIVVLLGATGSGKSSVVRAGLVPLIRQGSLGMVCDILIIRPRDNPFYSFASAIIPILEPELTEVERLFAINELETGFSQGEIRLNDVIERAIEKSIGTRLVFLVVDQWEEIHTRCENDKRSLLFIEQLIESSQLGMLKVVLTVRGDFFNQTIKNREFVDLIQDSMVYLGPMEQAELYNAVQLPAKKVGIEFESGLVDRIINDIDDKISALPLLEFVLTALWESHSNKQFTHEHYNTIGQLKGAIAFRAEEVYNSLTPASKESVRQIFMSLVNVGEVYRDTKLCVDKSQVSAISPEVLEQLVATRLLICEYNPGTGLQTVEISHEALLTSWDRLKGWINENRSYLLWKNKIRPAFQQWVRNRDNADFLLTGKSLIEAQNWLESDNVELNDAESEFIQCGLAAREREERYKNFIYVLSIGTLVILLIVIGFQWQETERQVKKVHELLKISEFEQREAKARYLASQALMVNETDGPSVERKQLLALQSIKMLPTPTATQILYQGSALLPPVEFALTHFHEVKALVFSPNGRYYVNGGQGEIVRLWDAKTHRLIRRFELGEQINHLSISKDNKKILAIGRNGEVRQWQLNNGRLLNKMNLDGLVSKLALDKHHRLAVISVLTRTNKKQLNYTTILWYLNDGIFQFIRSPERPRALKISPKEHFLAVLKQDNKLIIWDIKAKKSKAELSFDYKVKDVAFMQENALIIAGDEKDLNVISFDGTLTRSIEAQTAYDNLIRHEDSQYLLASNYSKFDLLELPSLTKVVSVHDTNGIYGQENYSFTSDLKYLAFKAEDDLVYILDLENKKIRHKVPQNGNINQLSLNPNGAQLATASEQKGNIDGDPAGSFRVESQKDGSFKMKREKKPPDDVNLNSDSPVPIKVTIGSSYFWDLTNRSQPSMGLLDFDFDERRLFSASSKGLTQLIDLKANRLFLPLIEGFVDQKDVKVGFVQQKFIIVDNDELSIWTLGKTQPDIEITHTDKISAATVHGHLVIFASASVNSPHDNVVVMDINSAKRLYSLQHVGVTEIALSHDGRHMMLYGEGNIVKLLETTSGKEVMTIEQQISNRALYGNSHIAWNNGQSVFGQIHKAQFSRNGELIAIAGENGEAEIWQFASKSKIGTINHKNEVISLDISENNKLVATGSRDKTLQVRDISTMKIRLEAQYDGAVERVKFSVDSRYLLTVSANKRIRLWDVSKMQEILNLEVDAATKFATLTYDNKQIIVLDDQGKLDILHREVTALKKQACLGLMRNLNDDELKKYGIPQKSKKTCKLPERYFIKRNPSAGLSLEYSHGYSNPRNIKDKETEVIFY